VLEPGGVSFDVVDTLQRGIERTIARNGLLFVGAFLALAVVSTLLTVLSALTPSLVLSVAIGALSIGLAIVWMLATVAALRTFTTDETERIPREHFRRNAASALLNVFVGGLVFGFVVSIGFLLLVIPGLFLLVTLFFWLLYVAVEDRNFVDGFAGSWSLTEGHRLRLFGLGVLVFLVTAAVNAAFALPGVLLEGIAAALVSQVGSALTTVFTLATAAEAFDRLRALQDEDGDEPGAGTEEDFVNGPQADLEALYGEDGSNDGDVPRDGNDGPDRL
jgi:hypothetical protein